MLYGFIKGRIFYIIIIIIIVANQINIAGLMYQSIFQFYHTTHVKHRQEKSITLLEYNPDPN